MDKHTAATVKLLKSWGISVEAIADMTELSPNVVKSLFNMKVRENNGPRNRETRE